MINFNYKICSFVQQALGLNIFPFFFKKAKYIFSKHGWQTWKVIIIKHDENVQDKLSYQWRLQTATTQIALICHTNDKTPTNSDPKEHRHYKLITQLVGTEFKSVDYGTWN